MAKKLMMMIAAVGAALGAWAETETVGDYTWTYQINGDTADITGVSPSTGAVTIPATLGGKPVTGIWHSAFSGCSGLESVTIPDSVTSIGSGAFSDCSGLTSVTIPDSVTSIESSAFSGCSGLTRVAIGNGLTYVGYGAFGNCTAIRDAELPGWQCDIPMENVERLVISQGTANIADYAFRGCGNLKSVTVPNSVTNIGESAFYNCCSLDSVTIPGSVENIGLVAFSHCSNLKGVTISPGVRSVGEQAFSECRVLESVAIPDSVTNIAGSAFSNCIGLKSVSIPGSMTNVNSSVFYGCSGVTNLTASFVPVGMSASQLQTVVIPDDTVCIKDWAFTDCSGLTGVTIPDGVTSIGIGAFQRCSGLASVTIPDSVTSIGAYAFYGCSSLESATIPNSVTDIHFTAFLDGGSLANVAIPQCVCNGNESVMSLFGTNITNVVVSAGVTSIGRSTFYDCSNLRSVTIPGSVASIANYAFEDCAALRSVFFEGNAPNTVGSSLFSYYTKDFCRAYVHKGTTGWGVAIPGTWNGINISYIEDGFVEPVDPPLATYKVAYEPGAYGSGQSQSATKTYGKPLVLAGALFTRSGYTQTGWSVSPNGYWLNYALGAEYTDNALITLYPYWTVDGGGEIMSETVNGLTWNFVVSDGEATIFGGRYLEWDDEEEDYTWEYIVAIPSDTSGTVTVPSSLGGYPVTAIGNGAFTECERITSVIIPSGVVSIGEDAFSDCTALVSVSLPEGLLTIGKDAFDGCGRLSVVALPSTLTTIGSRAFDGCSSLDSMDIPGKVTTIGYHAFARCTGLKAVTVSELLRSQITSNDVFYKCSPAISYNDAGMVTVTFDPNGGIGGSSVKQEYGSAIVAPTVARTGYTFTGWQPLPLETVPSNDVTYTAQWMANSYTVTFNANGAEGTMAGQPMTYDVPARFSALGFSKENSYFRGWAKSADGAVVYPDCAIVTNLTPVADGVVTLYAVWKRKSASALACEDIFAGTGTVLMNDDGSSVVTLTNNVSGTVEIPDNVGAVTIDLNGHNMVGGGGLGETALPDGPAIRVVKGDGDGATTRLAIVDTSEGEKGQIFGGGESAGIEVAEDAATGVKLDVEEGVGVFNGDGTEQEFKPKLVGTGTVTVPKSWKIGQKVTWKATADKGSVFARWEGPLVDSLNLTRNERRNPSLAFVVPEGFAANMVTAVFIHEDDDGLHALGITQTEFAPNETLSDIYVTDDSWSYVTASVKGLPSGLKFDAKTMRISGKATKPGVYKVTVSATNATVKKPVTAEFEIVVPNLASEVLPGLKQDRDAYGVVMCGVAFDPGLVNCSPESGWTVKAAGLPSGLKYDAKTGKISGVPTKAGTFTVTFTASKGKERQTATITLTTETLPAWATGTFAGSVKLGEELGSATMTVAANGKISGKIATGGTNWTFSAASFSRVESDPSSEVGSPKSYFIEAVAKARKETRTVVLEVAACDGGHAGRVTLPNGVVEGTFGEGEVKMWRNVWKDKSTAAAAKAEIARFEGVYTVSVEDGEDYGSGYLSLTVGKNGDAKASGKLADGTSVSATSPLMYDDGAGWFVMLYAAPAAYKGGAFAAAVGFAAQGGAANARQWRLAPVIFAPQWSSRNVQATGEYGEGFAREAGFVGAYYDKLGKLNAYYEALRLDLGGAPELGFTYRETSLNEQGRKATTSSAATAQAADTLWQDGTTAYVNDKGVIVVAKATRPVQDRETKEWSYDGANDGGLTLSFTQATGIFKGSYTFWYDYVSAYDETTDKETLAHTSKKVNFEGILVQGEDPKIEGFYLWDATGEYEDPKTGKPKTYKYKQSFPVSLMPGADEERVGTDPAKPL